VVLPADDAPHDRLTEWWYYTGHVHSADGRRFGFEDVIFRAERGGFPVTWASHLAITDETGDAFHYAQRTQIGPAVDRGVAGVTGFDLAIPDPAGASPWTMLGSDGRDLLSATLTSAEATAAGSPAGLGVELDLTSTKPAALHNTIGWIDFGAGGSSYYYSRTAMEARGSVTIDGETIPVTGSAWFDHQWGDFITVGGGGWDWFAVNLADGTDLTLSLVRDRDGSYPLVYGTLVTADGMTRHLPREAFEVVVTKRWTSPATGADYPAGWTVTIPGEELVIELEPTVAAQELDTRATTGVVYWEGSQRVRATRDGAPLGGEAYVELTGYAPAAP
jgi:predicted secreted hydrolase